MKEKYINELKDFLLSKKNGSLPSSRCNEKYFLKHNKKHLLDFFNDTYPDSWTLTDKINAVIKLEIFEIPKCEICGENYRRMVRLDGGGVGLSGECSVECSRKAASVRLRNISLNRDEEKAKEVRRKTMLKKYGVEYNSQRKEIKETLAKNNFPNREDKKFSNKEWLYNEYTIKGKTIKEIAEELKVDYKTIWGYIKKFNITTRKYTNKSSEERDIKEFIESLGVKVESNKWDIIPPYELDIYIPNHNIGIEINGLYWHSTNEKELEEEFSNKHINKTSMCMNNNIFLIHITDYQWRHNKEIIKSIIKNKLGMNKKISSKECDIRIIDNKEAKEFFNINSIKTNIISSISCGMYYDGELVSVLSLCSPRSKSRREKYQYEISEYSTKIRFDVEGGFEDSFKFLRGNNEILSVIVISDRMIDRSSMYHSSGFKFVNEILPEYFWTDGNDLIVTKYNLNNFIKNLKNYNDELSDFDNMINNGFRRFWDCGSNVYEWIGK